MERVKDGYRDMDFGMWTVMRIGIGMNCTAWDGVVIRRREWGQREVMKSCLVQNGKKMSGGGASGMTQVFAVSEVAYLQVPTPITIVELVIHESF